VTQTAPTYGFAPQSEDGVMLELQRLNRDHVLASMGLHGRTFFELIYFDLSGGTHVLGGVKSRLKKALCTLSARVNYPIATNIGVAEGWVLLSRARHWSRLPNLLPSRTSGFPDILCSTRSFP
jgi:hypothetical protein